MRRLLHLCFFLIITGSFSVAQRASAVIEKKHSLFQTAELTTEIQAGDSLDYINSGGLYNAQGGGYVVGVNNYDDKGKYQRFDLQGSYEIEGVYMGVGAKEIRPANSPDNISLVLRGVGNGGAPGNLIYETTTTTSALDTVDWTYFGFDSPISVSGPFFVGLEWTGAFGIAETDRFGLISDVDGDGDGAARAWEKWSDNSFFAISDANAWNLDFDIWIGVVYNVMVPVELTSFAATVMGNSVSLKWQTASETNNSGFEIQKKFSDGTYKTIGYKQGKGTTTEATDYSFVDDNVPQGKYTYKLKQLDFSGTFDFSQEIEVEVKPVSEFALAQNYPNPFNPSTRIQYSVPFEGTVKLSIYNAVGELISSPVNSVHQAGVFTINFNADNLPSGFYFYKIESNALDGSKSFSDAKKMLLIR